MRKYKRRREMAEVQESDRCHGMGERTQQEKVIQKATKGG